jgi:nucleoside-diphosphate-sugar epimerase
MSKYLVTGGAGFIGSNIAEELVNRGEEVVILDDLSTGHRENIADFIEKVEFIEGSITNRDAAKYALKGVDYVLHQGALASVPRSIDDPVLVDRVNVGGTLIMLDESRKSNVSSFVYAASSSAYGDSEVLPKKEEMTPNPMSPYAISKLAGEYYCSVYSDIYGLPTVALRYFNVFGPRQDPASQYAAVIPIFISKLLKNEKPTIFGDGEQSRDFTFVDNVVNANILAAKKAKANKGKMLNVACGEKYTLNELYSFLKEYLGKDIEPEYSDPRPGDVKHSLADITMSEKLLGYSTSVNFKEGLIKTIEWYRKNMDNVK